MRVFSLIFFSAVLGVCISYFVANHGSLDTRNISFNFQHIDAPARFTPFLAFLGGALFAGGMWLSAKSRETAAKRGVQIIQGPSGISSLQLVQLKSARQGIQRPLSVLMMALAVGLLIASTFLILDATGGNFNGTPV